MERGIITMSMKEAKRLHLVRKAIEKRITKAEAAYGRFTPSPAATDRSTGKNGW